MILKEKLKLKLEYFSWNIFYPLTSFFREKIKELNKEVSQHKDENSGLRGEMEGTFNIL